MYDIQIGGNFSLFQHSSRGGSLLFSFSSVIINNVIPLNNAVFGV